MISLAAAVTIGTSAFDPGAHTMDSRMIPRRMPASAPGVPGHLRVARVRRAQHRRARHGREGIARIVIAFDRVLQGVEDFGAVGDRAAEDAAAIAVDVRADGAAVEAEQRLVRQDQRHGVVIGRPAAGRPRFLAEAGHHQIGADRHARSRARAERGRARRVVGVGGIAAPGAALIAQRRRQHLVGLCGGHPDRRPGRCIPC